MTGFVLPSRIFVSYATQHSELADRLVKALRQAGHEVWRDRDSIRVAEDWREEIQEGIRAANVIVVIMTAKAAESRMVRKEINFADELGKKIITLMAEDVPPAALPFTVFDSQHIRCVDNFADGIQQAIALLPRPTSAGGCHIDDEGGLLDRNDRAIVSHFRKASYIAVIELITVGKSGSKVCLVDAAFQPGDDMPSTPTPHWLKIHHSQHHPGTDINQPVQRHEMAYQTSMQKYMPRLVDSVNSTLENASAMRIALLYSFIDPSKDTISLGELLENGYLGQARNLIDRTCAALLEWNQTIHTERSSPHDLLVRCLHHSSGSDKNRRLEDDRASVHARLSSDEVGFGLSAESTQILFNERDLLPNPLAYLQHVQIWETARKRNITWPRGHIHGDLNVRNILTFQDVDEITLSLIDFDTYDPETLIFLDLAYLEFGIILQLCKPDTQAKQTELERLSTYLAEHLLLTEDVPNLGVISVGIYQLLKPIRQRVDKLCRQHKDYVLAYWLARTACGLEMSRKTRVNKSERFFALLFAAHSLNTHLKGLKVEHKRSYDTYHVNWPETDNVRSI